LIAAAPEMLDALEKIDSALSDCLMVPENVLPAWNAVSAMLCRFHTANVRCAPTGAIEGLLKMKLKSLWPVGAS
jgi:hypothetical protein